MGGSASALIGLGGPIDSVPVPEDWRKQRLKLLVKASGKLVLVDKLLPKLLREGHKVLIFSQMVSLLDMLAEFLELSDYKFEMLTGRVHGNDRQRAIDRFQNNASSFVFLLSTRAGGVGINLTAADTVIIYDSDWNPQNDLQAMARCHRIGQDKSVKIYRLVTVNTFEHELFLRASRKLGLETAIMGKRGKKSKSGIDDPDDTSAAVTSAEEMAALLKAGAYALMGEKDDDKKEKELMDTDIDTLLKRNSRVLVHEGGSKTPGGSAGADKEVQEIDSAHTSLGGFHLTKTNFTAVDDGGTDG